MDAKTRTRHTLETMPDELRAIADGITEEGYRFTPLVLKDAADMLARLRSALATAERERAQLYATVEIDAPAIGLARLRLQRGDAAGALDVLDRAAEKVAALATPEARAQDAGGGAVCPHLHQDEVPTESGLRWFCLDCGRRSAHAGFRVGEQPTPSAEGDADGE